MAVDHTNHVGRHLRQVSNGTSQLRNEALATVLVCCLFNAVEGSKYTYNPCKFQHVCSECRGKGNVPIKGSKVSHSSAQGWSEIAGGRLVVCEQKQDSYSYCISLLLIILCAIVIISAAGGHNYHAGTLLNIIMIYWVHVGHYLFFVYLFGEVWPWGTLSLLLIILAVLM